MNENLELGIWGNSECVQCGACCYDSYSCTNSALCSRQKIMDGKSYCLLHESDKPQTCKDWFCSGINKFEELTFHREKLKKIAIKILRTSPLERFK